MCKSPAFCVIIVQFLQNCLGIWQFVCFSPQNSIRHNLSLHDMFVRETAQDGKVSYWTIRPEANRCLTLDQVYKVKV